MSGINEFYEKVIGQKLRTSQAWGCHNQQTGIFLSIWEEEIKDGRAYVGCKKPVYNSGGALHMNDQERKQHVQLIKEGVPAHAVLISNGLGTGEYQEGDKWSIARFDDLQVFRLTDLAYSEETDWYTMEIDLIDPIGVDQFGINESDILLDVESNHPKAFKTLARAKGMGWTIQGTTQEHIRMVNKKSGVMMIELVTGSYKRV